MAQLTGLKLALGGNAPETRESGGYLVRVEQISGVQTDHLEIVALEMTCADRRRVRRRVIAPDGLEIGRSFTVQQHAARGTRTDLRAAPGAHGAGARRAEIAVADHPWL